MWYKDEKAVGIGAKVATASFIGFMVLTVLVPWSSYTFFNYYLKEALGAFYLTTLLIAAFSAVVGGVTAYFAHRYPKLVDQKFFILLGAVWLVNYYLTLAKTSLSMYAYTEMNRMYSVWASLLSAPLVPIVALLLLSAYRDLRNSELTAEGAGGTVAWLFSLGCPSCGALVYSLIGVSAGLAVLPFRGLELKAIALLISGYAVSRIGTKKAGHTFKASRSKSKVDSKLFNVVMAALLVSAAVMAFNQYQLMKVAQLMGASALLGGGSATLANVDTSQLSSTKQTIAAVFPELKNARSEQDVIAVMLPSGTPEYSQQLGGITFDDPVNSLNYLAKWYYVIKEEVKKDPAKWQRYLNLAAAPRGISCEFCCGVGPQGITSSGNLRCGCQHNPAAQAVALGLIQYTDYSDAEILREVMKWKTTWFPRNMIAAAIEVAGKDPSQVQGESLPGMVGGC